MFGMRRSSLDITYDILTIARNDVAKTRIVTKTYLNFKIAEEYIEKLINQGLLEENMNGRFVTTEKGIMFLDNYSVLVKLVRLSDRMHVE